MDTSSITFSLVVFLTGFVSSIFSSTGVCSSCATAVGSGSIAGRLSSLKD
jgi:hypothetical protein